MKTREDILSLAELTRPVVGIEYRTAGEVYDIMCDRIRRAARLSGNSGELAAAPTPPAAEAPGQEPVAVPEFLSIARYKLTALQAAGWRVNGYSLIKEDRRGFIDHGGFVGWWLPEHYPQHTAAPPTYADAEAKGLEPGIAAAAKFVRQRIDDYIAEHGIFDPSTGVTEFPDGGEYVGELEEIEDAIRSLASPAPKGKGQ